MDAETCGLKAALAHPNVELRVRAEARRILLEANGKRVRGVEYAEAGETRTLTAKLVVVCAGAVNSAVLLLQSQEGGLANSSGAVGRHFMNHNASAVLAIDPRTINNSVYQKTLGLNDFYLDDGRGGRRLGNVQLLGRVTGPILKATIARAPEWALNALSRRSVDWYAMSEDLPNPESRVTVDRGRIRLDWKRSNLSSHRELVSRLRERLKAAGYTICSRASSIAAPPRINAARFGSVSIPPRRRSIPFAAPGIIPICSSSTARFYQRRRPSIRR